MIDFSKIREIAQSTQALAQAHQQILAQQSQATQQSQQADPTAQASGTQEAANQLFAQLGALLNSASSQPAQPNQELADLQQQAALLNAKVTALMAKADGLEAELNLSPTPDTKTMDELFEQFKEILAELTEEMSALQKQMDAKKELDAMKQEQKPTTMKPGEEVGDISPNETLSVV